MKSVWNFLNTRMEAIQVLLSKPKNVVTPQTFQKIAQEIEKLDAFMGLLKDGNDKFKRKKTFKPFKKLARLVDGVSSLQQEEMMLNQLFSKEQLIEYKRDVRKLKESKREDYFLVVDAKFVENLKSIKSDLEPFLRQTGKKNVSEYCKRKKKKISKILGKTELKRSKMDELSERVREYKTIRTLTEKATTKKDEFDLLLDSWKTNHTQISYLLILKESRVFAAKEAGLIKQAENKLNNQEADFISRIIDGISKSGF